MDCRIRVNPERELHELKDLYGIFFEDISYASDGGLYGELIQNRSFEYDSCDNADFHALYGWEKVEREGALTRIHVETQNPAHERNPHYLKLEVTRSGPGGGIRNGGFYDGIAVNKGESFIFSCDYCLQYGSHTMLVCLERKDGTVLAAEEVSLTEASPSGWQRAAVILEAEQSAQDAYLTILFTDKVCICMDMISLFPVDTFMCRENGLRRDLAQMLYDLKPKFVRFPGGCFTHIGSLDAADRGAMFRWKNTIGPVADRPARTNHAWHYHATGGLGFYEFFLFCEDIHAEPLPVVSGGVDPHNLRFAPLTSMQEWIDEACDLIEFANGDRSTVWGRIRCDLGHEKPFGLKYLAIGNEEVGPEFFERYEIICRAVHERYPEILLIGSGGPGEAGSEVDRGWKTARETPTSFVDEHYYQAPEWLLANTNRYQDYSADGPKAFLGEYASTGNTLYDALAESAYLTGIEKSAAIGLACYAPLLASIGHENWSPNLIWFDKSRVIGSVNYYAQKLFMNHQGDVECGIRILDGREAGSERKLWFSSLAGAARLFSEGMQIDIADVRINGRKALEDRTIGRNEKVSIGMLHEEGYEISFRAQKKNDNMTDTLEAPCFGVEFAVTDERNKLICALDGWEQLNSIRGVVNGQKFTSGDAYYEMPRSQWVHYQLKVHGRMVQLWIEGSKILETQINFPEHPLLYCCASKDRKNRDIILKAVNVHDRCVSASIELEHYGKIQGVEVWTLSAPDREAANTPEYPEKVMPVHRTVLSDELDGYEFPAYSLTVMRIQ